MVYKLVDYILAKAINGGQDRLRQKGDSHGGRAPSACPAGAVYLGEPLSALSGDPGVIHPVSLSVESRRRHLYVLGATGTGKSNLLLRLIESDIAENRSFCVFDLRGDLIDRVLLRMVAENEPDSWRGRLLLLDLRDDNHSVGFNPLAGAGDEYSRAFHILSLLRQQSESWGVQLEETLRNSLIALAQTGWSLLEIEPLLCHHAFRARVMAAVTDSFVRSFFERYSVLSDDQRTAWSLPVLNKITPLLAIPRLRRMFGQRQALPLRELLDDRPGQAILISLAVDRLHQAAYLVGGLLVSAVQHAIMARVDQPEAARVPVHLYIDEFETMATEQFEAIIAEGRRFGLGLCLSHQNLSQMPDRLRQVLLSNAHTQFYFQTGAQDASLLARELAASERSADIVKAMTSQQTGDAFFIQRGQPYSRVRIALCPDPDVRAEQVRALREVACQRFARPVTDIDRELAARAEEYGRHNTETSLPTTEPSSKPNRRLKAGAPTETNYEVKHAPRKGKFAGK